MLSKNRSNQPEKKFMQNEAKNLEFFILFFSKSAFGKIFYLMVLGLYTHELCKNAKKCIIISFMSQTLFETPVRFLHF